MYSSYILKSGRTGRYYYGSTSDLGQRLKAHNAGRVRSTKAGRPWELHHSEVFQEKAEAARRERFYKTVEGYRHLKENGIT